MNDYIKYNLQSAQGAQNITDKIEEAVIDLDYMPFKYSLYRNEPWYSWDLRLIPIGHYIIYYYPVEELKEVQIIRILYRGQDSSKHLPESL
ncbi:type II toxin-antitoxin system RelE/ParE family toxin [Lactiplantibacillus pentosus]|uniref:type II toxin-antitoxin system RelE/ParE family toxin n=1 Tax=Lactiplantibacillus pentosus TaxID=1589 RepID=UPI00333F69AC